MENLVGRPKVPIFASVFHGIRFKVRRLFVGMTSNFFLCLQNNPACQGTI